MFRNFRDTFRDTLSARLGYDDFGFGSVFCGSVFGGSIGVGGSIASISLPTNVSEDYPSSIADIARSYA
jgi:hypothetical protein